MKLKLTVFSALVSLISFAQQLTKIEGYAPAYVGQQIDLYETTDYISGKQERIASTKVADDSTFTLSFNLEETKKLELTGMNNHALIYVAPGHSYEIGFPDRNEYDPFRPLGNNVEVTFYNLDSTDINYKILQFNRWSDEFVGVYYTRNNAEQEYFAKRLDTFRLNVSQYYAADTTDLYFRAYIRYSLAKLDDLRFAGAKDRREKYQFYLQTSPVLYSNDAYMSYVNAFYEKIISTLPAEVNDKAYLGLIRSSPTLMFNALSQEYTLHNNRRLSELVLIKLLGEMYYNKDYPQTNVISTLDSIASNGLFEQSRIIAANMKDRITNLAEGALAPDFLVLEDGKAVNLQSFHGKYLYLIFIDPGLNETYKQLSLLAPIYRKYQEDIEFVGIVKSDGSAQEKGKIADASLWKNYFLPASHDIFKTYKVSTTPYYVLIDTEGYIVEAPALGPLPNGNRQTIDEKFFYINKALHQK